MPRSGPDAQVTEHLRLVDVDFSAAVAAFVAVDQLDQQALRELLPVRCERAHHRLAELLATGAHDDPHSRKRGIGAMRSGGGPPLCAGHRPVSVGEGSKCPRMDAQDRGYLLRLAHDLYLSVVVADVLDNERGCPPVDGVLAACPALSGSPAARPGGPARAAA